MKADPDWVTWEQAAAIVGCPVSTIDWHKRLGHIEHRSRGFARPSLRRTSVVAFAGWWAAEQAARTKRRTDRVTGVPRTRRRRQRDGTMGPQKTSAPRPTGPAGWLSTNAAAIVADVSPGHLSWLGARGLVQGTRMGGRWWYETSSLAAYASERRRWVSGVAAAELVGLPLEAIRQAASRDEVVRRQGGGRAYPSFERQSVITWAEKRHETLATDQARRQAAAGQRAVDRALAGRPDNDHDWLTRTQAAEVLGISPARVSQLTAVDRLPHYRVGHRIWLRRDHIDQIAAARRMAANHHRPDLP